MKLKLKNKNLTLADIVNLLLSDPHKVWSIPAAEALADYYTELENDWGIPLTFDRVAIRSDWMEFETLADARATFKSFRADVVDLDDWSEYLNDRTTVIKLPKGRLLVQNF
jgi:hypothetical protein